MDWRKVLVNVLVVAATCVVLQKSGLMGAAPAWSTIALDVLLCVGSNQLGLHQEKPVARNDGNTSIHSR